METIQRTFVFLVFSSCFREFSVMNALIKKNPVHEIEEDTPKRSRKYEH